MTMITLDRFTKRYLLLLAAVLALLVATAFAIPSPGPLRRFNGTIFYAGAVAYSGSIYRVDLVPGLTPGTLDLRAQTAQGTLVLSSSSASVALGLEAHP